MTDIQFIIICGASGTGKSSCAKYLKQEFEKGATIDIDSLRAILNTENWLSSKIHKDIIQVTIHFSIKLIELGYYPIIIVDTFYDELEMVQKLISNYSFRLFNLYADSKIIIDRIICRNRSANYKHDTLTLQKIINNALTQNELRVINGINIDTSSFTSKEIANEIAKALNDSVK